MASTSFQNLRMLNFMEYVSVLCRQRKPRSLKSHLNVNGSYQILHFVRFYRTKGARNRGNNCEKKYDAVKREAQAALLEYLHITRNLQFLDAENMSKNSRRFLDRLLKGAGIDCVDDDVGHSLARFLRYHPVNEFEPFFESIGLEPSEYASFLPRDLMFLSDDELLLHNYHVLCNYGIARFRIGKIFKEATEVFRYDRGILQSKLRSFLNLGLRKSLLVKTIASSPHLLRGNAKIELLEFLEKLKTLGIQFDWLEEHILDGDSYNWKTMLEVMCLLGKVGLTGEKLGEVIRNHPDLLFERSGHLTYRIFDLLLKFGSVQSDLQTVFLQFPHISVVNFINNLSHCYKFLVEIKMPVHDIGRMFRLYPLLLGSCQLKNIHTLECSLNCGLDRLCQMVKDDPYILKKWVLRVRVHRLPGASRGLKFMTRESKCLKIEFLSSLGFVEESEEMEKALKVFRGNGTNLQERFNCLVNAGLSREDVVEMVRVAPDIINQSKDVIERKIGCFVKELGYPVFDMVTYPRFLIHPTERVKLRLLSYKWLIDEGALHRKYSLSTILASTEEIFVGRYVTCHPRGPEFWERLKDKIYSV